MPGGVRVCGAGAAQRSSCTDSSAVRPGQVYTLLSVAAPARARTASWYWLLLLPPALHCQVTTIKLNLILQFFLHSLFAQKQNIVK